MPYGGHLSSSWHTGCGFPRLIEETDWSCARCMDPEKSIFSIKDDANLLTAFSLSCLNNFGKGGFGDNCKVTSVHSL